MDAKRVISWILTIAIVLGLAATGIVAALAAENTVITRIEATITGMEVGKPLSGVTVTAPADANYQVSINFISDRNGTFSDYSHVIGNQYYFVSLRVTAKAGYTFSEEDVEVEVYADGQRRSSIYSKDTNEYLIASYFNFGTPLDKAEVTVTGFEKGKTTSDVKATVPEGVKYKVDSVRFYSETGIFEGTFEDSKYRCEVMLVADEGYRFSDDIDASLNGEGVSHPSVQSEGYKMNITVTLDLRTVIDKVEVTVTGMEKGKSVSDVKITVPEGAKYEVLDRYFRDQNNTIIIDKIGGGLTICDFYLRSAPGYLFGDETKVFINGVESPAAVKYNTGDFLNLEKRLELRTLIEKVDLTVTGMEKDNDTSAVKATIPAGANYTVNVNVLKQDSSAHTGKMDDYFYTVEVVVYAKDGFYLDENKTVVRYNGSEVNDKNDASGQEIMFVNKDYFFGQYIDKVELPAFPAAPKVGNTIPEITETAPAGKNYTYLSIWADENADSLASGSKFENDKVYQNGYLVSANEGYLFAEDVTVTVGGTTYTGMVMNMGNSLALIKSYATGNAKLLSKIELSGSAPTAGKEPGTITSSGTGYKLQRAYWGVADNGNLRNVSMPGPTFQVGEYVYMAVEIELDEGYSFDFNAKVWYNGKSYDPIVDMTDIGEDSVLTAICLGQLKKAANPDTGDQTPVAVLTVLTVASVLGMGIVLSRRKAV